MKFKFPFIFLLFASQAQAQVPSTWTDTDYTAGALVLDSSGNSFIAQKDITKGTALTDTTAWLSLDAAAPTSAPSTTPPTTTPDAAQVASLTTPETSSSTASTARLINISTRGYVGTGDDAMIAGFVIEGDATATLKCMVGVSSGGLVEKDDFLILKDAFIILYKDGVEIDRNNDWTELSAEDQQSIQDANQVPGSTKDSALVWDLGPGGLWCYCYWSRKYDRYNECRC